MPSVLWTGKLTLPMWLLVNGNNVLALLSGNATDPAAMKARVRNGYEGRSSHHVDRHDELGLSNQERSADVQLRGLRLPGQTVLDVGCGTGVLALKALHAGARAAVCGDISMLMLEQAQPKARPEPGSLRFCQLDAEDLPFADGCFQAVLSGMTFGVLPDQRRALREMMRVVEPGGLVSIGAHGREHYWSAIDGCFREAPLAAGRGRNRPPLPPRRQPSEPGPAPRATAAPAGRAARTSRPPSSPPG
jgi:SAM-dependent methyltransferase